MDIWNNAKSTAMVAWDSIGGNVYTSIAWAVVDEISNRVTAPIILGAIPSGPVGFFANYVYNNMVLATKLSIK